MNELGLVIARRLIDAIGGTVKLESAASVFECQNRTVRTTEEG